MLFEKEKEGRFIGIVIRIGCIMILGFVEVDGQPDVKISMKHPQTGALISRKIGENYAVYSTSYDAGWSTDSEMRVIGDLAKEAMIFFNELAAEGWYIYDAVNIIIPYLSNIRITASSVKISAMVRKEN